MTTVISEAPVYYHYDLWGNTGCISGPNPADDGQHPTKLSGDYTRDGLPWECATSKVPAPTGDGGPTRAEQLQAFRYDYKDRLIRHETSLSTDTTARESVVEYVYDGLGRIAEEHRTRYEPLDGSTDTTTIASATVTELEHIATTSLVSVEHEYDVTGATPVKTETTSYGYDAGGLRLDQVVENLDDPSAGPQAFNFTYDVHGSVTQLVTPGTGDVTASYGYDAYGNTDGALTVGDTNRDNPLNRWRWAAERTDPLTGTQGMGARRYGPQQGRFLQADGYLGAVPNLQLSTDPLTSNRYAFAAGNPVTYIDPTGHFPTVNGTGTARFTGGTDSGASQQGSNTGASEGADRVLTGGAQGSNPGLSTVDATLVDHSGATWFSPFPPNAEVREPDFDLVRDAVQTYQAALCFRAACVENAQKELYSSLAHWHAWNYDYYSDQSELDIDELNYHRDQQEDYSVQTSQHGYSGVGENVIEFLGRVVLRKLWPRLLPRELPAIEYAPGSRIPTQLTGGSV